jgi:predicted nucleic acid-binding protein
MKKIVADASSLILLAKVGALETITGRLVCLTAGQPFKEATVRQEFPDAVHILDLFDRGRIRVQKVGVQRLRTFAVGWGLGDGESAAILLADRLGVTLLTDDLKAMQTARALGVPVTTSTLLIAAGGASGWWAKDIALSKLDALSQFAWVNPEIIEQAKEKLKKGGDYGSRS